jgi:undecaprenyl-diphosphatase
VCVIAPEKIVPSSLVTYWNGIVAGVVAASNSLYELANRVAGHSCLLDNIIGAAQDNPLLKGAILGSCFLAVWHLQGDDATVRRNRRVLLATLFACVCVIAVTQTMSKTIFLPRPFIQSQRMFHFEGNRLVENPRLAYRVPLDAGNQLKYRELLKGNVVPNDLGAFPSDHAGFYVTLAVGILLASPALGWFAVSWTFLVLLGSRVITGQHSPLDVLTGAGIGIVILLVVQALFNGRFRPVADSVVSWTLRHQALATALAFMAIFEVANTLQDLNPLLAIVALIARHFVGRV